jgi:sulfite reductase alpha subunit-like flavoprotein
MIQPVYIYFGSQTGTAEYFSQELADEGKSHGIDCKVVDLQDFEEDELPKQKVAIFIVSTYGEGMPTDNAKRFHAWAEQPKHDGALKGQRFTVMGLGDMNYTKFNNMGKLTDANLERLGGTRIYNRGVGDDSQDIVEDFKQWRANGLWPALKKAVADAQNEGGGAICEAPKKVVSQKKQVCLCYAQEDRDGASKDIIDLINKSLVAKNCEITSVLNVGDRKNYELLGKLAKNSFVVCAADVIAENGSATLCAGARKFERHMRMNMDVNGLASRNIMFARLTVANSACSNSAAALKSACAQAGNALEGALSRTGFGSLDLKANYIDAGVDDVEKLVEELCEAFDQKATALEQNQSVSIVKEDSGAAQSVSSPATTTSGNNSAQEAPKAVPGPRILCCGAEATEASEALAKLWPGTQIADATLQEVMNSGAQGKVVLAVQCSEKGLSESAQGVVAQVMRANMTVGMQLRRLRYHLMVVAATEYGNAGERASANAARNAIAQQAEPLVAALKKHGATCLGRSCLDLQDDDSDCLGTAKAEISHVFHGTPLPEEPQKASQKASQKEGLEVDPPNCATKPQAKVAVAPAQTQAAPVLHTSVTASQLPTEVTGEPADVLSRFAFEASPTKCMSVKQLRQKPDAEKGLSTMEIEFEVKDGTKLAEYSLGGTLEILPESHPDAVAAILPLLGCTTDDLFKYITFVPADPASNSFKKPFPTPCTLREALTKYCNLHSAPSKKLLSALRPGMSEEVGAAVDKLLADSKAMKVLQDKELCWTMQEFLDILGVKKLDLATFLLNCSRPRPREFTISSSPKTSANRLTLCVSLTGHELPSLQPAIQQLRQCGALPPKSELATPAAAARATRLEDGVSRGMFFGHASHFLCTRLQKGTEVLARQRPSSFHLPEKDVPIVMVGAGAGVAPFRGFWEELRKSQCKAPAMLFFGCRNGDEDWLFKDEMQAAVKPRIASAAMARMQVGPKKPLAALFPAFSRAEKKQYVQELIKQQAPSVKSAIEMGGNLYICGSSAMGNGVLDTLSEILEGGKDKVSELRQEGKIIAEMWG